MKRRTKRIWNVETWGLARRGAAALGAVALALALGLPSGSTAGTRVDLNRASLEELTSLPGIGPARARAIVERREERRFETADDLADVPGIGPSLVDRLRDQVEIGAPEPQAKARRDG